MKMKFYFIMIMLVPVINFTSVYIYAQDESNNSASILDNFSIQAGYGRIFANAGAAVDYEFKVYNDIHHFSGGLGIGLLSMYQYDKPFMGSAFVRYSLGENNRLTADLVYGSVAEEKGSEVEIRYDESASSYKRTTKGRYYKEEYAPSLIIGYQRILFDRLTLSGGAGVSFLSNPNIFQKLLWEHVQFQIGCGIRL